VLCILKPGQFKTVRWANKVKNHYLSRGYQFTFKDDCFIVPAEDLAPSSKQLVTVICDQCGRDFEAKFLSYSERHRHNIADYCRSCRTQKIHDSNKDKRAHRYFEQAMKVCSDYGYQLITDKTEYTDCHMTVDFMYPKHGVQTMLLQNLCRGHECFYCSYEKRGRAKRFSADEVEAIINSYNGNILLNKNDYTSTHCVNLQVLCGLCGQNVFMTCLGSYQSSPAKCCHRCSSWQSSGERDVEDYLRARQINYQRSKKFNDCADKRPLPFDFYLPDYRMIIEFDGGQHFFPAFGEKAYEYTKKHDQMKNEYAIMNDLSIIRIPYYDQGNIKHILDRYLT